MFCTQCDMQVDELAKFCPQCGSAATGTEPVEASAAAVVPTTRVDPQNPRPKKLPKLMVGMLTIALLSALFLIQGGNDEKQRKASPAAALAPSDAATTPDSTPPAVSIPPLRFVSSGRLPTKLDKFQLGMSVTEALGKMSDSDRAYNAPSSSQPNGNLWLHTTNGLLVICSFSRGRLVEISDSAEGISPDDEAAFRQNTMDQLGEADREIDVGPNTSYWIWIDGDVRVRYRNSLTYDITGSRSAEVEVAVYPLLLAEDSSGKAPIGGKEYLRHLKRGWGEDVNEVARKPLPKGLQGDVSLRMKPWQVRSVVPGIQIDSDSERSARGVLGEETTVDFWDGLVSKFCRTWHDLPPDQFPALHDRLIEGLGEPTEILPHMIPPAKGPGEIITWENTQVEVWYGLGAFEAGGTLQGVSVCFTDKELDRQRRAARDTAPPRFRAAPKIRSFF